MLEIKGIGISAVKYALLNFVLVITNLLLYASGPDGGGTGDREEGLMFYQMYLICLIAGFAIYGVWSITAGRYEKKTRGLTAIPVLLSSVFITSVLIYANRRYKNLYDGALLNDKGSKVLALYADISLYLVFFLLLFAVCISVLGILKRNKLSVLGLLLNLSLLILLNLIQFV
ncbi:hypothetical protein [Paenibacillus sp. FSL R7-0333]|uniref:hypothetical protein n=1 Tax=Paenibacillus sp. FSL R7-0333 TaxID=1926587 RepID=UPI00096E1771|nr:hypothetical protein BK146_32025 [Paenibacillus sp. FSL R7-0333]